MLTWTVSVPVALSRPEAGEGVVGESSVSHKRQKARRNMKKTDSGLRRYGQEVEDDVKRILQLQSPDAAGRQPGPPTDFFRLETLSAESDQQACMPSVELGRRKRRRSGEGALERPLKGRKPQGALPSAETDRDRGGEKPGFDWEGYVRSVKDQKENIAPIQALYDDDGRVVGTWRGEFRIEFPGHRFRTFYDAGRAPSVGSSDPSMRRIHPGRFPGAGQCKPTQAGEQSSQASTIRSATAPRTVASEGKAETGGSSMSGDTAVDYRRSIAGAEQASPEPADSKERG